MFLPLVRGSHVEQHGLTQQPPSSHDLKIFKSQEYYNYGMLIYMIYYRNKTPLVLAFKKKQNRKIA